MGHLETLDPDECAIVSTVAEFADKQVKPVVQELEHGNVYPEALIEQMKELGIYGVAVPEEYGGYGYSTEYDVERYFRDAPPMIVGEDTNEIRRNVIVSQLVARAKR
ncbi:hypothetical protein EEB14_11160 [Rhodococcus sp. WS4]|nr:hypothetical protein EEB14_11160 [Rhodococcus sp. WS4]